jgi:hypothetical protein
MNFEVLASNPKNIMPEEIRGRRLIFMMATVMMMMMIMG